MGRFVILCALVFKFIYLLVFNEFEIDYIVRHLIINQSLLDRNLKDCDLSDNAVYYNEKCRHFICTCNDTV